LVFNISEAIFRLGRGVVAGFSGWRGWGSEVWRGLGPMVFVLLYDTYGFGPKSGWRFGGFQMALRWLSNRVAITIFSRCVYYLIVTRLDSNRKGGGVLMCNVLIFNENMSNIFQPLRAVSAYLRGWSRVARWVLP
jgi:hypothetical protein